MIPGCSAKHIKERGTMLLEAVATKSGKKASGFDVFRRVGKIKKFNGHTFWYMGAKPTLALHIWHCGRTH